jgi:hypothetical protein
MAKSNFIILNSVLIHVVDRIQINVRSTLSFFLSIAILILDWDDSSDTFFNSTSIESFSSSQTISGVSVAMIKIDRARRQEGNPWIRPPNRPIDDIEYYPMMNRDRNTRAKTGIHITRVSLKRSLIRQKSSIINRCPSTIVSTIHLDDQNEAELRSNSLNVNRINTSLSSEQSIPLDEIGLSRLLRKSKCSSNQYSATLPSKRMKSPKNKKKSNSKSADSHKAD